MHKAWSAIDEEPYYVPRPSIKFKCHIGRKIDDFYLSIVFLDCNSSLNSQMVMKWYTKFEVA